MPYTPPAQRSPAASADNTPTVSRRSSWHQSIVSPAASNRPELPRSTSYLTRHRRTSSVKPSTFDPTSEPSPPSTADNEQSGDHKSLTNSNSLRQSPPPVTDESKLPAGIIISPPDSTQNSSDDEEGKNDRGRHLENLAELQAAIRIIEQNRESSPNRTGEDDSGKHGPPLTLAVPSGRDNVEALVQVNVDESAEQTLRKISHNRSNTESSIFLDFRQTHSPEASCITDSDEDSDDEEPEGSRRKPPMLRKKSGELVRPALRPSSRRRPSSMPGTPTFSKAVHFDSHLEHVRHFLQVDRPLAVSAGSSPVEAYDSDTEFPFDDDPQGRTPPFEWEIVTSNFPADTPARLAQPARVERVFLSADNKTLIGSIAVANLAYNKLVIARFTLDYWKTTSEVVAEYNNDIRQPKHADGYDRFNFNIKLADQANLEAKTMFFCVKYCVNGQELWDNNNFTNYQIDFRKKAKPQNGKKGMPGAASRPVSALPRSQKKSPTSRPKSMPAAFDDFADGFDAKYQFADFKQPVNDLLGDPNSSVRLKGIKSAVALASDNPNRKTPSVSGQAFGHRYDFGASLNAAIQAANSALGDRSGITMKAPAKKLSAKPLSSIPIDTPTSTIRSNEAVPAPALVQSLAAPRTSGTDSLRSARSDKPVLASQSYNELLDKYCFFGSSKNSPQLKEGTLLSGQYDGTNDDGYLGSAISTAESSPRMTERKASPSHSQTLTSQASRSASPAPMTGFVTGTSPMYPYNTHSGFSFRDAHNPTAIRG